METEPIPLRQIISEFQESYHHNHPYNQFVVGSARSSRWVQEWLRDPERPFEEVRENLLKDGIDPQEPFIMVMLRKELPDSLSIPSRFHGIGTFIWIVGEPDLVE